MTCVPKHLRGQANGFAVLVTHLFGDFPSPYIIGLIGDAVSMQIALMILMCWLLLASLAWVASWFAAVIFIQKRVLREFEQDQLRTSLKDSDILTNTKSLTTSL